MMHTIRVLIQPRPNFFELKGGDTIQLQNTIAALETRGVQVDVSVAENVDLGPYAVVQIYNFGDGCGELRYLINAKRQNKPVVVMPIYWNTTRFREAYSALAQEWAPSAQSAQSNEIRRQSAELRSTGEHLARNLVLEQSTLVLPNSIAEGNLLVRDFGADAAKLRVVYNGAEDFFAHALPDDFVKQYGVKDFVLCVARLSPQKNQLNLVRAWRDESVPLVLIGNDQEEPRYARQVREAAGPNTLFISHSPREWIASAYAAARVHALVSWYEMMPLAALEAGLAGCNLVLTMETAGAEFFGDKIWYCEPDRIESIHNAISTALAAPRRPELAIYIREHFTWANTATQLETAYREAIVLYAHQPHQDLNPAYLQNLENLAVTLSALAETNETLAEREWEHSRQLAAYIARIEQLPGVGLLRQIKRHLVS